MARGVGVDHHDGVAGGAVGLGPRHGGGLLQAGGSLLHLCTAGDGARRRSKDDTESGGGTIEVQVGASRNSQQSEHSGGDHYTETQRRSRPCRGSREVWEEVSAPCTQLFYWQLGVVRVVRNQLKLKSLHRPFHS